MYLSNRDSFPLNLTPQLIWKDDPVPEKMDQATRAADLVAAAVRFQRSLENNVLPPDVFYTKGEPHPLVKFAISNLVPRRFAYYPMYFSGGYALDMYQYKNLFYSTRIPQRGTDALRVADKTRFIVVQRGAKFYKVDVFDDGFMCVGGGGNLLAFPECLTHNAHPLRQAPARGSHRSPTAWHFG